MSTLPQIAERVTSDHDGSAGKYKKNKSASTGEGNLYEECVLALVFLRCLRRGLIFELSANNEDAGKFDDVVLVWRDEEHLRPQILCVQVKHKKSKFVSRGKWLSISDNCNWGLRMYRTSYAGVRQSLEMYSVIFVLMTNARPCDNSLDLFERQEVCTAPGLELLQAGGQQYKLNQDNQEVREVVGGVTSFVDDFYLLCNQKNYRLIVDDICKELQIFLGAGEVCRSISNSLCSSVREWKNRRKGVCLTRKWKQWQAIVDDYVRNQGSESKVLTARLKYCNVSDVWDYLEPRNLAWVRPPERGTEALPATKIHQALANTTHAMVTVQQFRENRQRILRCWGPFCQWLVIVDDYVVDDDVDDYDDTLSELVTQMSSSETDRRLVIVSWRENNNSFTDSCKSGDISDESWNDFLNVSVRLNGARYKCQLRDLVAGVDDLKKLLDGQPALLLALARLSQPLRMGQQLETLPEYYVPSKLVQPQYKRNDVSSETQEHKSEQEKEMLEVLDAASSIVIVVGRPGVGKSKMLSQVAKETKERDSTCWVLRVNLSEFYKVLDNSDNAMRAEEVILKATICNKDQLGRLEYALLRHSMAESPRVVCLVDGFDDVCPDYAEKCLEVLSLLARGKGKLVVTTNPAMVGLLEARMGVLAHTLRHFSKSELEDFFKHHSFAGNIPSINRLNIGVMSILRLPRFAKMFVKLTQEKADTNDIVTLYEAFFQNTFRLFYEEKRGDNVSAPGKKGEVEDAQKQHEEQLMLLAASLLSRSKVTLAEPKLDTEYFTKYGIVYKFVNGKPVFLHSSFSEHFFAKWCFLTAGEKDRTVVYRKVYVERRLKFFLESFDRRAVKGWELLEAVIGGNKGEVKALLARDDNPWEPDACGRNALHLAAAYSMQHSPSLLQLLCGSADVGSLSVEDSLLGWTPIRYAAEGRCWAAVKVLLEQGGDIGQLGDYKDLRHAPKKLRGKFKRGGYQALWKHVLRVNSPAVKQEVSSADERIQIQFALSLWSTIKQNKWLEAVAEKAKEEGHHVVYSIILRGHMRREEKFQKL